jgi:FtsP/CotA-like multicopper oxidase with cupredoxin domain
MKRKTLQITSIAILSVALLSIFAFDATENKTIQTQNTIIQTASADHNPAHHNIEMEAVEMPDGLYAYRMVSHEMGLSGSSTDLTDRYSSKPSIPGPTIIINQGETVSLTLTNNVSCEDWPDMKTDATRETPSISQIGVHVHGVHYPTTSDGTPKLVNKIDTQGAECGGGSYTYEWTASPGTVGTWPYHDHTFTSGQGAEDRGLFGTLIVNPPNAGDSVGTINGLSGPDENITRGQIEKEYVLWMVSTETLGRNVFYGMEIDVTNGYKQTPLWVNPELIGTEGEVSRWHVLGMGDEFHAFHLHGHRWIEAGTTDVIDTFEVAPIERHTFVIKAGEGVGTGDWMYHCHVFDHMEQGMSGTFRVLPDSNFVLPPVGATFAISDEPGLWFKTIDRGDTLEILDPRDGIGYPLDFLGDQGVEEILEDVFIKDGAPFNAVWPENDLETSQYSDNQSRMLALVETGETVLWSMKDSETKHTVTSLVWPTGAQLDGKDFFFNAELPVRGSTFLTDSSGEPVGFEDPGLYVFVCQIHPYMLSTVVVTEPVPVPSGGKDFGWAAGHLPLNFGDAVNVLVRVGSSPAPQSGIPLFTPDFSDLGTHLPTNLVRTAYVIMDPANWKDYSSGQWDVNLPPVPVGNSTHFLFLNGIDIEAVEIDDELFNPAQKGVGEVWINTQFELTTNKNDLGTENDKPGTITVLNAKDWSIEKKIAAPEIGLNHPHNMWSNAQLSEVYQTQWFDKRMAVFDRDSGELIKDVRVGESPSHVMTSPSTGKIYIAMNGEEQVTEIDPNTLEITSQFSTGTNSHPHGHWIGPDGKYIVTPNFMSWDASIVNVETSSFTKATTQEGPIATGMTPDGEYFFTANFLGNSFSKIDTETGATVNTINILPNGTGLPIQTPVSPDGKWMVTANVLNSKITVVEVDQDDGDGHQDSIVAVLPCDPGCHGVQWGAKVDGGYYAYVSNKFSNALIVVDPKEGSNAEIVGKILLNKEFETGTDDKIIGYDGMGGQGILTIPNVYNGWIQQSIEECKNGGSLKPDPCSKEVIQYLKKLTDEQQDPSQ